MVAEAPPVGKQKIHYLNSAEYWLVMRQTAQRVETDEGTDGDDMIVCLEFVEIFGLMEKEFRRFEWTIVTLR